MTSARAVDLAQSGVTLVEGDLRDPQALDRATKGIDVVFHIAAVYRQAGIPADVYRAINATAVQQIVEAAARNGVRRVVHCSTVGVHGDVEHPPANEDAPLKPGDIYQTTKLEGERLARETAARVGVPVTIVRPDGHLRTGGPAAAETVPRRGPPAIPDARVGRDLLPSHAH